MSQFTTTHTKSSVQVFQSKEYGRFHIRNDNRFIDETKVNRIIREIHSGLDLLKYNPITVYENEKTNKLEIIDGQHRFFVSKSLKSFVWYIVIPYNINTNEIARLNANSKPWKKSDFIDVFSKSGNKEYEKIQAFMDKWSVSLNIATKLLIAGKVGNDGGGSITTSNEFQKGLIACRHSAEAAAFMETASKFRFFKYWNSSTFLLALELIVKKGRADMNVLASKMERAQKNLHRRENYKNYLHILDTVYNDGAIKMSVTIY